jgi:hypothetical protein
VSNQKVEDAVWRAVDCEVFWAVNLVLSDAVYETVGETLGETGIEPVSGAVGVAVGRAVFQSQNEPEHPALQDFLRSCSLPAGVETGSYDG